MLGIITQHLLKMDSYFSFASLLIKNWSPERNIKIIGQYTERHGLRLPDMYKLEFLVSQGANLNLVNCDKENILHLAVRYKVLKG